MGRSRSRERAVGRGSDRRRRSSSGQRHASYDRQRGRDRDYDKRRSYRSSSSRSRSPGSRRSSNAPRKRSSSPPPTSTRTSQGSSSRRGDDRRDRSLSRSSDSSLSSSSSTSHERRRSRKSKKTTRRESRERDRKKEKKSKKHKKKKSKSKDKDKSKKKRKNDEPQYGAYGILTQADMYRKEAEFRTWLVEVKNKSPEVLDNIKMKAMYEEYMEDYNTATLSEKYYNLDAWEQKQYSRERAEMGEAAYEEFNIANDEERLRQHSKALRANKLPEIHYSRDQLSELKKVSEERVVADRLRKMGVKPRDGLGVRYEESQE